MACSAPSPRRAFSLALSLAASLSSAGCIIGFKDETSASGSGSEATSQGTSGSTGDVSTSDGSTSDGSGSGGSTSDGSTSGAATETAGSSGSTSDGSTTGSTGETEGLDVECAGDGDCALYSDCCSCVGHPVGQEPAMCDAACDVSRCEAIGVAAAVCRFGTCATERVRCDDSQILCDALPPACGEGSLPVVNPEGTCYTGQCAPVTQCDVVPECKLCAAAGWACVSKVAFVTVRTCEPVPAACGAEASCACAAADYCDDVYTQCSDEADGVTCTCLDC